MFVKVLILIIFFFFQISLLITIKRCIRKMIHKINVALEAH